MSVSKLSKKTETWTDEIEKLVARKVIHCNPMTILSIVQNLMAGGLTHDEFEQALLDLKISEFRFLTEFEKDQAAIRQANADRKRAMANAQVAASEDLTEFEPSHA